MVMHVVYIFIINEAKTFYVDTGFRNYKKGTDEASNLNVFISWFINFSVKTCIICT